MRFTFAGAEYRILFRHDASRKLEDHVDHEVTLMQETRKRKDGTDYEGGPAYLVCETCTVKHQLATPLRLTGLNRRERRRLTYCHIAVKDQDGTWVFDDLNGVAMPNEKAGDQFTRVGGCYHALAQAIGRPGLSKQFRKAVWDCYLKTRGLKRKGAGK